MLLQKFFPTFIFLLLARIAIAQNEIKTPDAFLPHHLGEQFTPHYMLTDYFEYLAANCSTTMKLQRYGYTNEARPLQVAIFSSPENMERLEDIQQNNLRLAGLSLDRRAAQAEGAPAIVWLNMSIHGNEPSGSECSMLLAWQLATQSEAEVKEWLKNTVVIIDPSSNPDGYNRYTNWYRAVSNTRKNPNVVSREHHEPWPGGRPNHYYYDLNRDWAWATQVETQQRISIYQQWLPHVVADVHEQYIDDPYYFAPAAEPMHAYITGWQREFQTEIGANHARYFDANGWLYFTKEVFDLLYPSYGDTYPMFNGAIGMTYEQAGHGMSGRAISTANGDTLTLHDRIAHHLTTCRSTIEMASKSEQQVVNNFRDYYSKSVSNPPGNYGAFIIRAGNDPNRVNKLCTLLDRHQIRYGRAGASLSGVKGFDYLTGKDGVTTVQAEDLVIPAAQPKATLVQVLFEPQPVLTDSLTYDITAWAVPFAQNLDAFAAKQRIEPKKAFTPWKAPEMSMAVVPYAWCVRRNGMAEFRWLSALLEAGAKVRYATEAFDMGTEHFDAGTFVVNRADNRHLEGHLDQLVKKLATESNIELLPLLSGSNSKGADMGSAKFKLTAQPSVAIVYGDDVDENAYGQTWYYFEQELGAPLTMIETTRLKFSTLKGINTLIFPNGKYHLDEKTVSLLRDWVNDGGRIIAMEGGVKAFADNGGFDFEAKETETPDSLVKPPYQQTERYLISDQLPGAVIKANCDNSHPLGYGMRNQYYTLKTSPDIFELNNKLTNVVTIGEDFQQFGFIGCRVKPQLRNTPVVSMQQMGNGSVVYMVDNPLFRSFWQGGKMLMANALFF